MRTADRHGCWPMARLWQRCRRRVAATQRLAIVGILLGTAALGAAACANGSASKKRSASDASVGCVRGSGQDGAQTCSSAGTLQPCQCAAPDTAVDVLGTEGDAATDIDSSNALSCADIESAAATAFRKTFNGYQDCQVDTDCTIMDLRSTCLFQCTVVLTVAAVEDVRATADQLCQQFAAQGCIPFPIPGCLKEFPPKCLAGACTPQYESDRDANADEGILQNLAPGRGDHR
jgi:hypothetical protein